MFRVGFLGSPAGLTVKAKTFSCAAEAGTDKAIHTPETNPQPTKRRTRIIIMDETPALKPQNRGLGQPAIRRSFAHHCGAAA